MAGEMYQCVCHTCEENDVSDELDQAQKYFNEHADQGCEVVLRNLASRVSPVTLETSRSTTTTEDSDTAED